MLALLCRSAFLRCILTINIVINYTSARALLCYNFSSPSPSRPSYGLLRKSEHERKTSEKEGSGVGTRPSPPQTHCLITMSYCTYAFVSSPRPLRHTASSQCHTYCTYAFVSSPRETLPSQSVPGWCPESATLPHRITPHLSAHRTQHTTVWKRWHLWRNHPDATPCRRPIHRLCVFFILAETVFCCCNGEQNAIYVGKDYIVC